MKRSPLALVLAFSAPGLVAASGHAAEPIAVPRYRLDIGQELTYRSTVHSTAEGFAPRDYQSQQTVWVVRKNADGGWRLVLQSSPSSLTYCDLSPNGHMSSGDVPAFGTDLVNLFPRLPDDDRAIERGWQEELPLGSGRSSFAIVGRPGGATGSWVVTEARKDHAHALFLAISTNRFTFVDSRGLVTKVEGDRIKGHPIKSHTTFTSELASEGRHDADWSARFAEESDLYFAAWKSYYELQGQCERDAASCRRLLDEAKAALADARGKVSLPMFRRALDDRLQSHDLMAIRLQKSADRLAEVLGKPAAEWRTTDLAGEPHSLADYRGRVVLLDFWFHTCGPCLRSMPQLVQLAEDFRGQPVAILGMNTDEQEADAKRAVEAMGLNYPILKGGGLVEKYGVQGFPTLIVIDRKGKVRDVHLGYSPTLRTDLTKVVNELLSEQ